MCLIDELAVQAIREKSKNEAGSRLADSKIVLRLVHRFLKVMIMFEK